MSVGMFSWALYSALLKKNGHKVEIFDTTYYAIDYGVDADGTKVERLNVVPFDMGTLMRVNNVSGTPVIGTNIEANTVSLYSRRKTASAASAPPSGGYEIGKARVYSFGMRNAPYINNDSQWNLHLFDVQTYLFQELQRRN